MLDLKEKELKTLSNDRLVKEYMEKLNSLNKSSVFKKMMTEEQEREMLENTIKYNAKQETEIEIAKTMLKENYKIEEISKITNLSIDDIKKLK